MRCDASEQREVLLLKTPLSQLRPVLVCFVFQMLRLTQKEQTLEQRLEAVCQENAELKASLVALQTRLDLHDQQDQQQRQQVNALVRPHTLHTKDTERIACHSTARGYSAFCLAARVSMGLLKDLLNNHLIPAFVTLTHKSGFRLCLSFSSAGIWFIRICWWKFSVLHSADQNTCWWFNVSCTLIWNKYVPVGFQLAETQREAEAARGRSQQLQAQVEELQEEVSLQESRSHLDASLLSELETADLGVSRAEVSDCFPSPQLSFTKTAFEP